MSAAVVYRMFDAEGTLLYVGCSGALPARLQAHVRASGWWDTVARVDVEHFDTREKALCAEIHVIANENPAHNILHKRSDPDRVTRLREARIQRRAQIEAERRARRLREDYWTPDCAVVCTNCGRTPTRFPKGKRIEETPCQRCGVEAFERRAA